MSALLQQFFSVLTESPGSLIYHLVLAFSVAGALLTTVSAGRLAGREVLQRTTIGLGLLLLTRVALFLFAGIAWQSLLNQRVILPPLDRSIAVLGVILIAWMWVLPNRVRLADTASVILLLLVLTATLLSYVWWSSQGGGFDFNGSWPDRGMQLLGVLVALGSLLALGVRRPAGWSFGFILLALLLSGHLYQLILPPPEGDYSGFLRLTQMIAYPLLLALPQRFTKTESFEIETYESRRSRLIDADLVGDYLSISRASSLDATRQAATRALTRTLGADVGILIETENQSQSVSVLCVWSDRFEALDDVTLDSHSIPVILSSWHRGRGLILPADSTSPDLSGLVDAFGWQWVPHILAAPIPPRGRNGLTGGIILVADPSSPGWHSQELDRLTELLATVAHLLHPSGVEMLSPGHSGLQNKLQQAEAELERVSQEKSLLEKRIQEAGTDAVSTNLSHDDTPDALAELLAAHEDAQDLISKLQVENERLVGLLQNGWEEPERGRAAEDTGANAELRLALDEVARLRSMLSNADKEIVELRSRVAHVTGSGDGGDLITSVAQELRQPMSSIVGYTDILLGETVGILGSLQRKYLERVKSSSQRMNRLVNDLIQISGIDTETPRFSGEKVDLAEVFDNVLAKAAESLQNEDVSLRIDFPAQLPYLVTDPAAISQALLDLVENACEITPPEGEIGLSARLEKDEDGHESYILIRVSDQGGGIAAEDIPHVFSSNMMEENRTIVGIGARGDALPVVKALIEALGGRIWVDSKPGIGSTFSLLMPVTTQETGIRPTEGE